MKGLCKWLVVLIRVPGVPRLALVAVAAAVATAFVALGEPQAVVEVLALARQLCGL